MPEFVCRSCSLKVASKTCDRCKSDKHTYEIKRLTTTEEVEELIRKRGERKGFGMRFELKR